MPNYFVYILHCENNAYYTGYTIDLIKRYQSHCNGEGKCKYTRSFKPLAMKQAWLVEGSKANAMQIERFIKKLSRKEKENLINYPIKLANFFPITSPVLLENITGGIIKATLF